MEEKQNYPYSDDLMIYDSTRNRYQLTEKALTNAGIRLRDRLERWGVAFASSVINEILRTSAEQVYNYIHDAGGVSYIKDGYIASIPELRNIIFDAMLAQTKYLLINGDYSNSLKVDERRLIISPTTESILNQTVHSLGTSIIFAGD